MVVPLGPGQCLCQRLGDDEHHLVLLRPVGDGEPDIGEEGAGALPTAAALTGKAGKGPVVAIVSGGNIDLKKFCELSA